VTSPHSDALSSFAAASDLGSDGSGGEGGVDWKGAEGMLLKCCSGGSDDLHLLRGLCVCVCVCMQGCGCVCERKRLCVAAITINLLWCVYERVRACKCMCIYI